MCRLYFRAKKGTKLKRYFLLFFLSLFFLLSPSLFLWSGIHINPGEIANITRKEEEGEEGKKRERGKMME